jgi:hypothetical protein
LLWGDREYRYARIRFMKTEKPLPMKRDHLRTSDERCRVAPGPAPMPH